MVCADCKEAGQMNAELNAGAYVYIEDIRLIHKQCRGGTWCDCMHKVGVFVGRSGVV